MDTKSGKSLKINFLPPRSGLLDSNQRPRAPQTCALPTALNPDFATAKVGIIFQCGKFSANFFCFFFLEGVILV